MTKFFLLAHYDDEIFALPLFSVNQVNYLIFLTNGVGSSCDSAQEVIRHSEAIRNLEANFSDFGIEIVCLGRELGVSEGELYKKMKEVVENPQVRRIFEDASSKDSIITTSFEGAHQDHDAACLIGRRLSRTYKLRIRELSTYPQLFQKIYSFSVMRPKVRDQEVKFGRIETSKRAFRLMKGYKTQRKTWVGLGLQVIFSYLFLDFRTAKPASMGKLEKCFYDFRGRADQMEVLASFQDFTRHYT